MAAVRAFVLLFVLSAVCALQASASPTPALNLPSFPLFGSKSEQVSVETSQSQENTTDEDSSEDSIDDAINDSNNFITKALEQIKKLIASVKKHIVEADEKARKAVDKIAHDIAANVNKVVKDKAGVDLKLTEKLDDLESKIKGCNSDAQPKLKELVDAIRVNAESCAAEQVKDAKALATELKLLVSIVDTVPQETVAAIKECYKKHDEEPEHETKPNFFASWGEKVEIAKCIAGDLVQTVKDLKEVPETVYNIIKQVQSLTSPAARLTLEKCAVTAVTGQLTNFQTATAELASCVIGPKKDQA